MLRRTQSHGTGRLHRIINGLLGRKSHGVGTRKGSATKKLGLESLEERQLLSSIPLHVEGNQLKDLAGNNVVLRGVNLISLEWRPDGDNVPQAVDLAINDWHANLLRLPVNQDFWFGHDQFWTGGESGDGGAAYRAVVDQVVSTARERGVYVMLDMHWSDMGVWGASNGQHFLPDDHTDLFWQNAAGRYANNPAVLFDPYNEPHFANDQPTDAEFAMWHDGGFVHETGEFFGNYHSPGIQGLINTIRAAGANNIVAPEGLNWGSNLSGVLTGHALSDPAANIIYQTHLYPNKLADNEVANSVESVSRNYPIYVGEWGSGGVIGWPSDDAAQSNRDMLDYLNAHPSFSWTAWAFTRSLDQEYNLLTDWNGDATTSDYGAYVKSNLAAAPVPVPAPAAENHIGFGSRLFSAVGADGPQLVASGSFNSNVDSITDLAVTNLDGSVSILLGRGDGYFNLGGQYFVDSPEGIVAGDFNRDGAADLAVASNAGFAAVLTGDGNGDFTRIGNLPDGPNGGTVPTYLTVADMDKDGILDLVVADFSNPNVLVYTGQGDGSFQLHDYNYAANGVINAEQVVVADFNDDGNLDIAVANKGDGSVSVFRGLGGGYITAAGNIQLPTTGSIGLATGDLDGDGKSDLAVANYGNDDQNGGAHRVNILLNTSTNGDISFGQPASIDFGNHLLNVVIADFNEDGRADLAVSSSGTTVDPNAVKDHAVWVLYNQGQRVGEVNFPVSGTPLGSGWNPIGLIAVDLNGDSHLDLVSADQDSDVVSAFLNEFESAPGETPPPVPMVQLDATLSVPATIEAGANVGAVFAMNAPVGGANVTGTVTFEVDGVQKKALSVNSLEFSYQLMLEPLSVTTNPHNITVRYSGDPHYSPITMTKTISVTKRGTLTRLSSPASVAAGNQATLTATVNPSLQGMTGAVTFQDGKKTLGSAQVVNGIATFQTNALSIGTHNLTAVYQGDASFAASEPSNSQLIKITGDVTSRLRISKSTVTIDPNNGQATQTITLSNTSGNAVPFPLTLAFRNLTARSKRIGVVGQTGASGSTPLLAISNGNGMLMPGESLTIQVLFSTTTNKVKYTLAVLYQ